MMKTQLIGASPLVSTRLAYGCMRIAGTWNPAEITPEREAAGRAAVIAAWEAGYTLFDHADIYCRGGCESIFGKVLKEVSGMRAGVLIATKCGIRFGGDPEPDSPHRYDFSAEHIQRSCEGSLKRLGIDTIDLYQLHRPDLLMDPAEIVEAFDKLRLAGKVRYFGVSNFMPSFVTALQKACPFPLIVNQVQISLARLDCFYDGTLDQCLMDRITPLAWSPVGGGFLATGGTVSEKHPHREEMQKLQHLLDEIAGRYGATRTALSLAWLLKHPSKIIPIVGSANPQHIRDATQADRIDLTREDWYRLLVAARMKPLP
jgi:predicted oxidoreductase